jgi:rRNA maturation endonuclease Nob1
MTTVNTELDYLVLDAGAIIRGHGLNLFKSCKKVVTVPEVIAEIRDSKARELFNSLPYEIEERAPSIEAFKAGMSCI